MNISNLLFVGLLCGLLGCASHTTTELPTRTGDVTILVAADGTLEPFVTVYLLTKCGDRQKLGRTDDSGAVVIARHILSSPGAQCLLFEKEGFFTGALWLVGYDVPDAKYISLARFTIM